MFCNTFVGRCLISRKLIRLIDLSHSKGHVYSTVRLDCTVKQGILVITGVTFRNITCIEGKDAMKNEWMCLSSKNVYTNRLVNVRLDTYHFLPKDIIKDFTVLELEDWVNVIPVTREGLIVTIRQYRHGVRRETVEIPGGLISSEDASPREAAIREMIEETGYTSDNVVHIGTVEPNPAIQTNRCYTFLARDCVKVSGQNLDPTESVQVELVPREDVFRMIQDGTITHALVVAAFAHLLIHENGPGRV